MPELREVFEMVKQQIEPDVDSFKEQERRMRRTSRNRKLGVYGLVAALAAAMAFVVVGAGGPSDRTAPAGQPSNEASVAPSSLFGFVALDITSGDLTPTGIRATDSAVDVSPDGSSMVYADDPDVLGSYVHVANVDGSGVRGFEDTRSAGEAIAPRWSPDGTMVVYQGLPGIEVNGGMDIGNVYVLDVETGDVTQITDLDTRTAGIWYMAPSFTADGTEVLFTMPDRSMRADGTDRGTHWDVWSVPVAGGDPTLVLEDAMGADVSPDGEWIAYSAFGGDEAWFRGLYVARADGTDVRKLVSGSIAMPRWSPDGSRIAYEDGEAIYALDIATGESVRLSDRVSWTEWIDDATLMIDLG